jgi:hypothetical protein
MVSKEPHGAAVSGLSVLLAQEDEAERGEGVECDPETCDQLLLEGQRCGLNHGLLDVGQLLELVRFAGINVVDEAVG